MRGVTKLGRGSVAWEGKVAADQGGELLLPARELEPVRLEFVGARAASAHRLPLGNQGTDRFLKRADPRPPAARH